MNRIKMTKQDVQWLLKWRDHYPDKVRSMPAPVKAIEIIFSESGWRVKGIRNDQQLKLYFNRFGRSCGHVQFFVRGDGKLERVKNRANVDNNIIQDALTVYSSLMAFMVYGKADDQSNREAVENASDTTETYLQKKRKNCRQRVTYIQPSFGAISNLVPKSHRASPSGVFSVRGHWRHYRTGKTIWIAEYQKGTGNKKTKTYKIKKNDDI